MSDGTRIQVRDLQKTFRIPHQQFTHIKERVLHPFASTEYDELKILRGVSFDVKAGEMFGIVGRNGSGKSTLLKCLAGIYKADRGTIHVAGLLCPFIELGVGFNPELTALDNVRINAVMLGMSPREARNRFASIMDFAELHEFRDLKLKNYSSGMQVRLAFAVLVESGADVMLIDEVLAVGDAAFQNKCIDFFREKRAAGSTTVLVTHSMGLVEQLCDRGMLLHDGEIEQIGDPVEVGKAYMRRNAVDVPQTEPVPESTETP